MGVILGLDSGSSGCSAALVKNGAAIASVSAPQLRGQSQKLVMLIDQLLQQTECRLSDIDLIAATAGPGSFTGIRVTLATAFGLQAALQKPVMGVPSLGAVAMKISEQSRRGHAVLAIEPGGKGDYHSAVFSESMDMIVAPYASAQPEIPATINGPLVIAGQSADAARALFSTRPNTVFYPILPPYDLAAEASLFAFLQQKNIGQFPPSPIYLRDADVTLAAS